MMHDDALGNLIARQRPNWSLEQAFYTSPEIYEIERRGWLAKQWYILGHVSEVPEPGSYMVRDLLGESLIVVRDMSRALRGFYNVCRHRGSRICDKDGRTSNLVCPYHAWSYRLDGSLRAAPALPEGIDTQALGLRCVPVREVGGIILGSLTAAPAAVDPVQREFEPGLRYCGFPEARIAARRRYPTHGNWKLVIENFIECYHCIPCHPEYASVMKHIDVVARDAPQAAAAWKQEVQRWYEEDADTGSPLTINPGVFSMSICGSHRAPIGGGRKTQSQDGRPVAPLMGGQRRFDGGVSGFRCEPFIFAVALNDHALMFQFLPNGPEQTDVVITWLVDSSAREDEVDVERMVWLWDVTTLQDKAIIERNAAGVRSRAYTPGPYSTLESWPSRLVGRYLKELATSVAT
jgi:phenylpropionate dioxygenase-like ring-hydroxylating dioxygenase large terminal subunit